MIHLQNFVPCRRAVTGVTALLVGLTAGSLTRAATVYSDNFTTSTLNAVSPAPPTPTAAAYHLFSSKTWSPAPSIGPNDLRFGIGPTTSGHIEAQALFTSTPLALTNVGDYLELTVTFVNSSGLFAQSGHIGFGLYNSGGVPPRAGGMNSTAVSGTSDVTGGAQGWQGYVARLAYAGGSHRLAVRPAQMITTGNNQDLVTEGSGSQSYVGNVNVASTASTLTQPTGTQLTKTLRFTLVAVNNLQLDSKLYVGAGTNGTLLVSQTATVSGANLVTDAFDALAIGWRDTGNSTATLINIQSITVTTSLNVSEPGDPPVAVALAPVNGETGQCVDTLLRITFDKPVLLQKSGPIRIYNAAAPATPVDTINLAANVDHPGSLTAINVQGRLIGGETFTNHPVIISGNTATIFPHAGVLTTNQTYYVLVDSGVFTDLSGTPFAGINDPNAWRFTTKPTGPANTTNLVVAADGSGDFCTVQGAVDFVPAGNTTPRLINIRDGVYTEIVNVNNRHNLTFRGQSRSNTIIAYANNSSLYGTTHFRMTFKVNANDIALDTLTITNSTPKGGSQAEALMVQTDRKRFIVHNVNLCSFQDTILMNTSGTQCYFQDSLIQGDVDFIWGGGNAFFTHCEIKSLFGGYLTQARTSANSNGISFVNCRLTRAGTFNTSLGRALGHTNGNVAFINCRIDSHITGWTDTNARYWEFGNSNLLGTAAVSYNGTQLAANSPDLTNARTAVLWLNGWSPALLPNILSHPTNQSLAPGDTAVFSVVATGIPAPTYQWRKNGVNLTGATNETYEIAEVLPANNGAYSVLVSTPAGSVVSSNATLTVTAPQARAFPGAEGAGAYAVGGRGGDVYYVTTLANTGTGSLRNGISGAPASGRTILFKVSGNIILNSTLTINRPNITVAGQTAPGDGICLQNYSFNIAANNVILRHVRTRLGTNALQEADAMWINGGTNIIVDHVSASWSVDETLSTSRNVANLTVQNCFITESLRNSIHSKGAHGYGGIISSADNATFTYHHNLFAHHSSRNPRVGSDSQAGTLRLDFRNNVVYNWGFYAGYSGGDTENVELNYVNNYFVAGPASTQTKAFVGGATTTKIFQSGNFIDGNKNGQLDGSNTGWNMFGGTFTQMNQPFEVPGMVTDPATVALQKTLATAGAMPWRRDAYDQRIARTVRGQTGLLVDFVASSPFAGDYLTNHSGGINYIGVNPWPTLTGTTAPTDTDNDGMPDFWELAQGLNPLLASDRNLLNPVTGYTKLEEYLNWRAEPHALCDRNGIVELNLRTATGGATNLTYAVANDFNGTVTLLPDGYTARFTAAANTNGSANFTFTATGNGTTFGPMPYGILITLTDAPVINTPPGLTAVSNRTVIAGTTINFTNSASDTDVPAQILTFSLENGPEGASLNSSNGVFHWRPAIAQSPSTHTMQVIVADDGTPSLSATQTFAIAVLSPQFPTLQAPTPAAGHFLFEVTGDAGPDYLIQASTNLAHWSTLFITNPPTLPFTWHDPAAASFDHRFYRVQLGP